MRKPSCRLLVVLALIAAGSILLPAQEPSPTKELVRTFEGHPETVYTVATSPDGQMVLTGSFDRTIKLWGIATARELRTFGGEKGHQNLVLSVAFAPDGQTFASGGADNSVRIWEVPAPRARQQLALSQAATAAALSTDGKSAAAGATDGSIQVFSPSDGKELLTLKGHVGAVTGLAYAPNNAPLLASTGVDGTLRFWNLGDGKPLAVIVAHATPIQAVGYATGSNVVFTAGEDGLVKFWQAPPVADRPLAGHGETVRTLALSADGNTAITGSSDKNVRLFTIDNGQMSRTLTVPNPVTAVAMVGSGGNAVTLAGTTTSQVLAWSNDGKPLIQASAHAGEVTTLAVHPNGNQVISGGADGNLAVWSLPIQPAKNYRQPADGKAMSLASDGKRALITAADNQLRVIDLRTGNVEKTLPVHATAFAASLDGSSFAWSGPDNVLRWQKRDGSKPSELPGQTGIVSMSLHPSGSQLLAAYSDGSLKLWSLPFPDKMPKPIWEAKLAGVKHVAIEPKGQQYLAVAGDKALHLGDLKTGKELKTIPTQVAPGSTMNLNTDGSRVAVLGEDQSIKVLNLADGKELATIALPGATRVALAPKGDRVAVAHARDNKTAVSVVDVATGRQLLTFDERFASVAGLAFDPASRALLIAADKQLILTDVPATAALPAHPGGVTSVSFLPSGTLLTGGKDKTVKLWEIAAGKEQRVVATMAEPVNAVAVSRDGATVAVAAGKLAKVFNVADGKELQTLTHPAEVLSLGFSPDRTRLVTGTSDNLARVWDLARGHLLQAFSHGAAVHGVAIPPNKPNIVITASADKTAIVRTLTLQRLIEASPKSLRALAVHPSGGHLFVGGDDPAVKLINIGNGNIERTFAGATAPVLAIAVSRNQQLVATASADKLVRLYTINDGNQVGQFAVPAVVRSLAFHPNNTALFGCGEDKTVAMWNIAFPPGNPVPPEFGKPIQTFEHPTAAASLALSNDGGTLLTAASDKLARVWRVATDGPIKNLGHPNLVDAVAYSKDSKQLATACHDGNVRIWDVEKGNVVKEIKAHSTPQPAPVYAIAWSPDGKQIASGSLDKSIKIWDAASGNLVREIKGYDEKAAPHGHRDGVFTVAWTPDGTQLISGSSDRSIKAWNVATGAHVRDFTNPNLPSAPMQPPSAHPGWIYQVRFTSGGQLVSVGGAPRNRGYIALWNPADGKLLQHAELPLGPFYGVALTGDPMQFVLACGPRSRQQSQADAVLLKLTK